MDAVRLRARPAGQKLDTVSGLSHSSKAGYPSKHVAPSSRWRQLTFPRRARSAPERLLLGRLSADRNASLTADTGWEEPPEPGWQADSARPDSAGRSRHTVLPGLRRPHRSL